MGCLGYLFVWCWAERILLGNSDFWGSVESEVRLRKLKCTYVFLCDDVWMISLLMDQFHTAIITG